RGRRATPSGWRRSWGGDLLGRSGGVGRVIGGGLGGRNVPLGVGVLLGLRRRVAVGRAVVVVVAGVGIGGGLDGPGDHRADDEDHRRDAEQSGEDQAVAQQEQTAREDD